MRFVNVFGEHLLALEKADVEIISSLIKKKKDMPLRQIKFIDRFNESIKSL